MPITQVDNISQTLTVGLVGFKAPPPPNVNPPFHPHVH